nr:MAG TPA: Protein of unknown function (DUF2639) [Caudoviricetes sp.]
MYKPENGFILFCSVTLGSKGWCVNELEDMEEMCRKTTTY